MPERQARVSTDEESAPLLQDNPENGGPQPAPSPSVMDRLGSILQDPLTPLNKILLILLLIFLLLFSIFIGLFLGSQHKLNNPPDAPGRDKPPSTVTSIITVPSITTATVTATVTGLPPPGPSIPPAPEKKECLTPQCVVLSAAILSSLDTTQDPCENFYEYATGGWRKAHPLPSDKGRFGSFALLFQENQQIVKDILNINGSIVSLEESADQQLLAKLRNLYYSCMDEDTLDQLGEGPLKDFIAHVRKLYRGESTVIPHTDGDDDDPDKKQAGLTAALAFLHSRGIPALFEFGVEGDSAVDPNFMILWFQQPSLGLPSKEYFEEKSMREAYASVLERLLAIHYEAEKKRPSQALVNNDDPENTWPPWPWPPWDDDDGGHGDRPKDRPRNATELAEQVVKFERKLAQASLDLDILLQDPLYTYNKVPISNITETITQVNFPNYFATFTPRNYPTEVVVTYPAYSLSLTSILNETESDVLEAYLVTRAALSLAPRLGTSTESWKAVRNLQEVLQGIKPGSIGDRAEYCVNSVDQALGYATGRYFVNETFAGDSKEKGTKVITDIVKAFKKSLSSISWMDEKSASAAAEKADAIRVKVGYPTSSPDIQNAESLLRYYTLVDISKFNYFKNMLSASSSDVYKQWQQLGKRRDLNAWEMTPATVNAYYNPPANEIVFPAGILQPPFFHKDWPAYLKYGAFGQVASHELTHAFDSAGRLYNQEGKLEEWWTNATSEKFLVKQSCIEEQYSSYTVDDGHGGVVHVNGKLTSGENIGDSGLIQAYRAWKTQFNDSLKAENEYLLPGLNHTRDQLFFIAFGRIWAENTKPEALVQRLRTDPHSPSQFRVDGTLHNIPEFAKAFNCSPNAKLNPPTEKRCLLWS